MQLVALRSKPGLRGPGRSPSNSDLLLRHPSLLACLRTTSKQHWKYNCIWAPYSIKQLKMTFSRLSLSTICDDNAGCYGVSIFGVEVYRAGREMVKIGGWTKSWGQGRPSQGRTMINVLQRLTNPTWSNQTPKMASDKSIQKLKHGRELLYVTFPKMIMIKKINTVDGAIYRYLRTCLNWIFSLKK